MKSNPFCLQNWPSERLKIVALLLFAWPLLSNCPVKWLSAILQPHFLPPISEIFAAAIITFCVWLFCALNAGFSKLLDYLSGAFLLAITTVLTGVIIRMILPISLAGEIESNILRLARLFYNILMVVPYSLLAFNSISSRKLIESMSRAKGKRRELGLHLALALRIFQHVGVVVSRLLLIWREEHPLLILPRVADDLKGVNGIFKLACWFYQSVSMWIFACIILTFEPIPLMVQEIEQIFRCGEKNE